MEALLEAIVLLFLGDVQKDFDQRRSARNQLGLECVDLFVGAPPVVNRTIAPPLPDASQPSSAMIVDMAWMIWAACIRSSRSSSFVRSFA